MLTARPTRWTWSSGWTPARTTTSPSRSGSPNCTPASAPICAATPPSWRTTCPRRRSATCWSIRPRGGSRSPVKVLHQDPRRPRRHAAPQAGRGPGQHPDRVPAIVSLRGHGYRLETPAGRSEGQLEWRRDRCGAARAERVGERRYAAAAGGNGSGRCADDRGRGAGSRGCGHAGAGAALRRCPASRVQCFAARARPPRPRPRRVPVEADPARTGGLGDVHDIRWVPVQGDVVPTISKLRRDAELTAAVPPPSRMMRVSPPPGFRNDLTGFDRPHTGHGVVSTALGPRPVDRARAGHLPPTCQPVGDLASDPGDISGRVRPSAITAPRPVTASCSPAWPSNSARGDGAAAETPTGSAAQPTARRRRVRALLTGIPFLEATARPRKGPGPACRWAPRRQALTRATKGPQPAGDDPGLSTSRPVILQPSRGDPAGRGRGARRPRRAGGLTVCLAADVRSRGAAAGHT